MTQIQSIRWRAVRAGLLGGVAMVAVYTLLLAWLGGSWRHPLEQFLLFRFWITPLIVGFALQVGLWRYVTLLHQHSRVGATVVSAGSGGLAMAACCAHHVADLLPLLGLTAAAAVVVRYQTAFFILALASNALGILLVVRHLPWVHERRWSLVRLRSLSGGKFMPLIAVAGGLVAGLLLLGVVWVGQNATMRSKDASASIGQTVARSEPLGVSPLTPAASGTTAAGFVAQSQELGGITITATPVAADQQALIFDLAIDNHRISLDYDFAAISAVIVDGNRILAMRWEGGRGGHHLQGRLVFPALPSVARKFQLAISGVGGADYVFKWEVSG